MRRADVETHWDGYGRAHPAVNVKVYGGHYDGAFERALEALQKGEGVPETFTLAWIDERLSEDEQAHWWNAALEEGWELLRDDLGNSGLTGYGSKVELVQEGRSGGWAAVHGLPELDRWDAVLLGRWARFAKWARETTDDTFYRYLDLIHANVFAHEWEAAQARAERAELRDQAGL